MQGRRARKQLLVELYLDADRRAISINHVWTREVPPRGVLLRQVPRGAREAIRRAMAWFEHNLNECEHFPMTCARGPKGKSYRTRCPACSIRKALGMPALPSHRKPGSEVRRGK